MTRRLERDEQNGMDVGVGWRNKAEVESWENEGNICKALQMACKALLTYQDYLVCD